MFNPGEKVIMNGRYHVSPENVGKVWEVDSLPWNVCGTDVVRLKGRPGSYAVDGLSPAPEDFHAE